MLERPAFAAYRCQVREEWVDYNGHMRDSSYGIVLSEANEALFAALGLSADYRAATGASLYTVEGHLRYLAECSVGHALQARTLLVAVDQRRLRLYTELLREGLLAATGEFLYLHVDAAKGASTDLPADRYADVTEMLAAHATIPRPAGLGAGIAWERPRRAATPQQAAT